MSKENLVKTISNKIFNNLKKKYGDNFKKLNLDLDKIKIIVNTSLTQNNTPINKTIINNIIEKVNKHIDKIITKKINQIQTQKKPQNQAQNQAQNITNINNDRQPISFSQNNSIEEQLNKFKLSLNNKQDIAEQKEELDTKTTNELLNNKFINLDERDEIKIRKIENDNSKVHKNSIQKMNIALNKNNKNCTFQNQYSFSLVSNDFLVKNIYKLKLKQCILETNTFLENSPYLILKIDEISSKFKTGINNEDNVFCYLDLYKKQNKYLYYDINHKYIEFNVPININSLTITILDCNFNNIDDKIIKTENIDKNSVDDSNDESTVKNDDLPIKTHLVFEIEYNSKI